MPGDRPSVVIGARPWIFAHQRICLDTREPRQFIDVTARIEDVVRRSSVGQGLVHVQSLHTTTAIVVNEAEPLLLEDLKDVLQRLAPSDGRYRHDDLGIRTVNLVPGERPNGHSHAQALALGPSQSLCVADGTLQLGRWQRIFLVELDGPRCRTVSVTVMGLRETMSSATSPSM